MPKKQKKLLIYFSDYFDVDPKTILEFGAFNVSLINDLPLFIDPFLLFSSESEEYRTLHADIIRYVSFLRDKAATGTLPPGNLKAWFMFPEVKQTWLGFSRVGNSGSGLGMNFAQALCRNLHALFQDFGAESVTKSSHLEKLCLIDDGVGRDNISDFTTNLIKKFLLTYTQEFAQTKLKPHQRKAFRVPKVEFDYDTETWSPRTFVLPCVENDFVVLTPRDLLTKDETWINRTDLYEQFDDIVQAVPDDQLRAQINNYLVSKLPKRGRKDKEPTQKERRLAVALVLQKYPTLLDYYLRHKEDSGDEAEAISERRVDESETVFIKGVLRFVEQLSQETQFYETSDSSHAEARKRVLFLKDVIENMDGYRLFYGANRKPVRREADVHLLFRLTWYATLQDVNREVNNGRGPVDFKVSRGARNASLVEFKLASNSKLESNLANQVEIYKRASGAEHALKVIVYFTRSELARVNRILKKLELREDPNVILIDARGDNKPSASKVR